MRIAFVGVSSRGLDEAAAQAIADATFASVDPAAESVASAHVRGTRSDATGADELLELARRGSVVRIVLAEDGFDERATRTIAALAEASVTTLTMLPAPRALPLAGKRVLVTRASEQSEATARALRARGAIPIVAPTIVIGPPDEPEILARAVTSLGRYDVVAFTSANGVDATFRAVERAGLDARAFGGRLTATIGPGTAAALARHGVLSDVVAEEHRGEALAQAILARIRPGARVLLPRATIARDALPAALAAAGITVDVVPAYRTRRPDDAAVAALRARLPVDAITFTSSSTVDHFCELVPDAVALLTHTVVASIGPITSATCRARGLRVDVESSPYTIAALVAALEARFQGVTGR